MALSDNVTSVLTVSIQTSIQSHVDSFPPTMRRVADVILERPQIVMENTISELARACDTSEASIVRFCRALGFTGYPQLKLQLAAELAKESAEFGGNGDAAYGADISPSDTLAEMVAKIAGSEILGIRETADSLDMEVLQRVIRRLERAKRVVLFGVGASNAGAQDLAQKLLRIGHVALAFHDAHDALVSAALVEQGDVAIGFSHNGRTRETMAFLSAARRNGAHTVAVTNARRRSARGRWPAGSPSSRSSTTCSWVSRAVATTAPCRRSRAPTRSSRNSATTAERRRVLCRPRGFRRRTRGRGP